MQASIKLEVGPLSVNYKGTQDFIDDGLTALIQNVLDATEAAGLALDSPTTGDKSVQPPEHTQSPSSPIQHVSTSTIASKIGASSGPDLIVAALGHLELVKGTSPAQRQDIAEEMKGASAYYKNTYVSNLSSYLTGLVKKGTINQVGTKTYALTAAERSKMENLLAVV